MGKSEKRQKGSEPVSGREGAGLKPAEDMAEEPGFLRSVLPEAVFAHPLAKRLAALPEEKLDVWTVGLLATLLFVPWLGSVGLWDPWETHYGEVARSMIQRNDYVYPFWENAYFFSKPPLTMWLTIPGMLLVGTNSPGGSIYTEWAMRLPFAALAVLAVVMLTLACRRIFGRRVGIIAGLAMATSPMYFLIARQAVTDMPFVALLTCALSSFLIAEFSPAGPVPEGKADPRALWWYAFYAFSAFATLGKELMGFAFPGLIILVYLVVSWDWKMLKRARIPTGALLFAAIAVPWFTTLCLFNGKDDESKSFAYRMFIHDNFNRLVEGVYTTTPGGNFSYFIEQLGFGVFPWVAVLPGALLALGKVNRADPDPKQRATIVVALWALLGYLLFSLSATKFHHYCLPLIPALAVLCALYADQVWREGVEKHMLVLLVGFAFFIIVFQNLILEPKALTDLFVFNYTRPYPDREVNPKAIFIAMAVAGSLWLAMALFWRAKGMLHATFLSVALAFAVYVSWLHWKKLSFHWSQRDIFWSYGEERKPGEPIGAYYMNWRGETFYSKNKVKQLKDPGKLLEFVGQPGREWVIVEQNRFAGMKQTLGDRFQTRIVDSSCNKFYLVSVD